MNAQHSLLKVMGAAVFAAATAIPASASACLWDFGTAADGSAKVVNRLSAQRLRFHAREPEGGWALRLKTLESAEDFATNLEKRNDYAVALIRLGRQAEAVPILQAIEKANPGQYVTAVNLGTAYELLGKDDLALKWIVEGVKRNPNSHDGTEWLHVRILEAKIALRKDAGWLRAHSVFDGGAALTGEEPAPKMRAEPVKDRSGSARNATDIIKAVDYQLTERLQFVKPPEPVVAELLLELASLTALQSHVEPAIPLMKQSGEFRPARAELHAQRTRHFDELVRANEKSGKRADPGGPDYGLIVLGIAALSFLGAVYLYFRSRRARKSAGG